jgi:hypothetical protein
LFAESGPTAAVMGYEPALLSGVAVVLKVGCPVTPEVASVSLFVKFS